MSLIFDLKQVYCIAACLSLALGLIAGPVGDAGAKTQPRKTEAQNAKQKAKAAALRAAKAKARAKQKAKSKPVAAAPLDPAAELDLISSEAETLRKALEVNSDDAAARQKLAELALRAIRASERALSRGDEDLFGAYRVRFPALFADTPPLLEKMSERGIGSADYALGALALHGMLAERNVELACARFAAAIDKGFGGAKFRHAQCIEDSDPARAFGLLKEAADSGHIAAGERLGRICLESEPPDAACAFTRLERAAKDGRRSAKALLGWMHAEGIGGSADLPRAARYYKEAAEQGEPSARNNLGELYERGRGVEQDERLALDYYKSAADTGFPPAQFNLGRLYAAGRGTEKNDAEARRWLGEAAKAGIAPAQQILDMLDRDAAK